jgi:hypothetical protein
MANRSRGMCNHMQWSRRPPRRFPRPLSAGSTCPEEDEGRRFFSCSRSATSIRNTRRKLSRNAVAFRRTQSGGSRRLAHVAFDQELVIDQPWTDWAGRRHPSMVGRPVSMHAMRGISAHSNGFHTCRAIHILQMLLGAVYPRCMALQGSVPASDSAWAQARGADEGARHAPRRHVARLSAGPRGSSRRG